MTETNSLDIDTPMDWAFAEFILKNKFDETC